MVMESNEENGGSQLMAFPVYVVIHAEALTNRSNHHGITIYKHTCVYLDISETDILETRDISANLKICHFNIKEISRVKSNVLSRLMNKNRIDVNTLQEIYTTDDKDLRK